MYVAGRLVVAGDGGTKIVTVLVQSRVKVVVEEKRSEDTASLGGKSAALARGCAGTAECTAAKW